MSRLILLLLKGMDKSPGVGMVFLTKNGIADKTIILFLSDNGGLSLSPPRQKPAHSHNLPLRAGKGSVYEGEIRIPTVVRWPGITKPGTSSDYGVIVEDFFPTFTEMAKVRKMNTVQAVTGKSLVPALRNPLLRNAFLKKQRPLRVCSLIKWLPGERLRQFPNPNLL